MVLTEDEAKTKTCHEGLRPQPTSHAGWAYALPTCLASECMAWRWFDNINDQAIKEPKGYCGKAGQP